MHFWQLLLALTTNNARTELAGLMQIMPKFVAPLVPRSQAILRKSTAPWRAEFKYDGERLQVHVDKQKRKVKLFSRILVERLLTSCTVDLC
jgi:ATP-dependent DNA ligase